MDPEKMGIEPVNTSQEDPKPNEDPKPEDKKEEEGADVDSKDDGGTDTDPSKDQDGADPTKSPSDTDENANRVNGLLSEWHKAQNGKVNAEAERDFYKTEYEKLVGIKKVEQNDDVPYYLKPDWKPETYADIGKAMADATERGKKMVLDELNKKNQTAEQTKQQVDALISQIEEVDKEFDKDDFYKFANAHKFPMRNAEDLKPIYSAYVQVRKARRAGESTAKENKTNRQDKVIGKEGSGASKSEATPYSRIKGKSLGEIAHSAFNRIKGTN